MEPISLACQVAYQTFSNGELFIRENRLELLIVDFLTNVPPRTDPAEIDGVAALQAMEAQHGILVERAHKIHSFAHLTFQEHFTAKFIATRNDEKTFKLLLNNVTDTRWREVFLQVASMLL